jgi:hypothetical protein
MMDATVDTTSSLGKEDVTESVAVVTDSNLVDENIDENDQTTISKNESTTEGTQVNRSQRRQRHRQEDDNRELFTMKKFMQLIKLTGDGYYQYLLPPPLDSDPWIYKFWVSFYYGKFFKFPKYDAEKHEKVKRSTSSGTSLWDSSWKSFSYSCPLVPSYSTLFKLVSHLETQAMVRIGHFSSLLLYLFLISSILSSA